MDLMQSAKPIKMCATSRLCVVLLLTSFLQLAFAQGGLGRGGGGSGSSQYSPGGGSSHTPSFRGYNRPYTSNGYDRYSNDDYRTSSSDGGGGRKIDPVTIMIVVILVPLLIAMSCAFTSGSVCGDDSIRDPSRERERSHRNAPNAHSWVRKSIQPCDSVFPSGKWRGYYVQYGSQHSVCDFTLNFSATQGQVGQVSGNGVDDIGEYTISGIIGGDRTAFQKQYKKYSRAEDGMVNAENLGHKVEYRGIQVGHSLAQGIKGEWFVSTAFYSGSGDFHLWPASVNLHGFRMGDKVVARGLTSERGLRFNGRVGVIDGYVRERLNVLFEGASDDTEQISLLPSKLVSYWASRTDETAAPRPRFEVTSDNVCVICFQNPINACLQPCGHVASCDACANKLNPPNCPICRTKIDSMCRNDGNPFATASAPPLASYGTFFSGFRWR